MNNSMKQIHLAFLMALSSVTLGVPPTLAQAPQALAPRAFDVASIKPNRSVDENYTIRTPPGGRFTGRNVTVRTLILYAFDLKDFQLINLPGWCNSERFDIEAKAEIAGVIDPEALRPLIRTLLSSRFGLAFHRETKELPLFALDIAKGGSKLHPNTGTLDHSTDWGSDHINATAVTVAEFGRLMEVQLDRVIVDESGISGVFDFHLTWTPDSKPDTSGPSLFTALQEQYGLRLESKRGSVEVVVIDRVDRPSEN